MKNLIPSDRHCLPYNGTTHPTMNNKCCSSKCGAMCGRDDCDEGPGGNSSCCGKAIPDNDVCGYTKIRAPCTLGIDIFNMNITHVN